MNDMLSLSGANNIIGRMVILHEKQDVCTQPVGDAGSRYAQCVIGIANPASNTPANWPAGVPNTQDFTACLPPTTAETTSEKEDSASGILSASAIMAVIALVLSSFF